MENALKNVDSIVKDRKLSVGAKALFFYILSLGNTESPDRNSHMRLKNHKYSAFRCMECAVICI